jgi:transposase
MVEIMEEKYGKANRIWVMDRGMVSEENIEFMQERGARYLVGTPKSMLIKFERELVEKDWEAVHPGVEVKKCASPEGKDETFVLCRSEGRKDKETAILNRFIVRLEAGLNNLKKQAEKGRLRDQKKAERRIGRLLERNSRAALLFDVIVTEIGTGKDRRIVVDIKKKRRALSVGASERRQLHPAHQLEGGRPKDDMEAVHPTDRSGRRLQNGKA